MIGSRPSSDTVRDPEPRRAFSSLEGVRLEAADRDVTSMAWRIVQNLYDFQRLFPRGSATSTKANRIEIDESAAARFMDAASWPAELVIRRCFRAGAP